MASVGKNMKIDVAVSRRGEVHTFYRDVLGCTIESPNDVLDLIRFADGFSIGTYYVADDEALDRGSWKLAPWIEILVDDLARVKDALGQSGFTPFEYVDTAHAYFEGPGGLVFRLAQRG